MQRENAIALISERRSKPRVHCTYPALVCGPFIAGPKPREQAILCNLSRSGLYLQLKRCIEPHVQLFVVVCLSFSPLGDADARRLALRATVVRNEALPDGTFGVGMRLDRYRFL